MTTQMELRDEALRVAEQLEADAERLTRLRGLSGGRGDDAADALEEELRESPLCVERIVTYRVTLGTGGPACGVDFSEDGNGRAWYQDWFTPKAYVDLTGYAAAVLRDVWDVDYMIEEDSR